MSRYLKESRSEIADKIAEVVGLNGFWTRENEFEDSMSDAGLSVDYMDYETAEISDEDSEESCRVYFNHGGRSFTISKIKCFDEDGNSFWYEEDDLQESLDDEYDTYRVWYHPFDYPDEEDYVDIYAKDTKDARYRGNSYGYVTDVEFLGNVSESRKRTTKLRIAEGFDVNDNLQDIWDFVQEQEYDSAATSQNQLPGGVKAVTEILKPGTINLDYGGGRYDQAVEYLKQVEVMNLVFDPFNRSKEHNKEVLDIIQEAGGADSCTCCNVLNVIDGDKAKITALKNIKRLVKPGGKVYIQTYEGSDKVEVQNDKGKTVKRPSGVGKTTTKGWQENKETKAYIPIVKEVFDDATYKNIKGVPMIVCTA